MDTVERNVMLTKDIGASESSTRSTNIMTMTLTALRINLPKKSFTTTTIKTDEIQRNSKCLPEITLEQVAYHDSICDCWMVLYDRVYDVTKFLDKHPGGEDIMLEYAGRDATIAFRGTGHSKIALNQLRDYVIGELPSHQRIYRGTNSSGFLIQLSDIPD